MMIVHYCSGMDIFSLEQQRIVVLNGTTTAGKSSTALELKKRLEKELFSVEVLAIDTFMVPKVQLALGINRLNPLNCFVPNIDIITPPEIEAMGKASQIELCTAAKSAYEKGKIVIIDAPIYRPDQVEFYQRAFDGLNVTWALVYCPLSKLVNRVIERNEKSGITEQRSILQALNQFSQFYSSSSEQSIDILSTDTLFSALERAQHEHAIMQDKLWDFLKSVQHAICPFDFETIKQNMLRKISFGQEEKVMLGSVVSHDCFVNTDEDDAEGCAEKVMDVLFGKLMIKD